MNYRWLGFGTVALGAGGSSVRHSLDDGALRKPDVSPRC